MTFALYITALYVLFVLFVCLCGERWARVNRYPVSPITRVDQDEQLDITPALRRSR